MNSGQSAGGGVDRASGRCRCISPPLNVDRALLGRGVKGCCCSYGMVGVGSRSSRDQRLVGCKYKNLGIHGVNKDAWGRGGAAASVGCFFRKLAGVGVVAQ